MADAEWNDAERPDLDLVARIERKQRVVVELVLLDLVAEQATGERRGVDRDAREAGQDVWQTADVVFVRVRDHEGADVLAPLAEVGHIRDHEVDPEHLLVREHQSAVDDDDVGAVLEDVHVLADLPHPAERDDAERRIRCIWHAVPVDWWSEEGELVRRDEFGRGRLRLDDRFEFVRVAPGSDSGSGSGSGAVATAGAATATPTAADTADRSRAARRSREAISAVGTWATSS